VEPQLAGDDPLVEDEPEVDWDFESSIILALMRIEAKLEELLARMEDDDGEEGFDA